MKIQITLILCLVSFWGFSQTVIPAKQAYSELKDKNRQLIDVRTPQEYASGHIQHAVNINWNDQKLFTESLKGFDKNKPVYLYCRSGVRSAKAAAQLSKQGFTVYDIQGGILEWEKQELPLEEKKEKTP